MSDGVEHFVTLEGVFIAGEKKIRTDQPISFYRFKIEFVFEVLDFCLRYSLIWQSYISKTFAYTRFAKGIFTTLAF